MEPGDINDLQLNKYIEWTLKTAPMINWWIIRKTEAPTTEVEDKIRRFSENDFNFDLSIKDLILFSLQKFLISVIFPEPINVLGLGESTLWIKFFFTIPPAVSVKKVSSLR